MKEVRPAGSQGRSGGAQTKQERGPSTADFAEGFIDWFLLGESDFVVAGGGMSFGDTAVQRSSRQLYDGNSRQLRKISLKKDDGATHT